VNVESQRRDPDSLLRWTIRMIRLRKECPEIGWGEWRVVPVKEPDVLALEYSWRGNRLLCVHNLGAAPREISVRLDCEPGEPLVSLLGEEEEAADESGRHRVALDAYGYGWFRLGGLSYALRRRLEIS
jgi:maltose alpha-D-glucosyltransferase/alpha-amylase